MRNFIHIFLILQFSFCVFSVLGRFKTNKLLCSKIKYQNPVNDSLEVVLLRDDKRNPALCNVNTKGVSLISEEYHFIFDDEYAYDRSTDLLYRGDLSGLHKLKIHPGSEQYSEWNDIAHRFEDDYGGLRRLFSVAYDWISKNLYVRAHNQVLVVSMKNTSLPAKVLFNDEARDLPYVSVHVFPKEGYLISQKLGIITRYNLDGSNPKVLYNTEITIKVVALDYYQNDIYWIEKSDNNTGEIRSINLSGGSVRVLLNHNNLFVGKNLAVDESYVYFSVVDDSSSKVLRANKKDGSIDPNFKIEDSDGKIISTTVLSGQPQGIPDNHPCKESNGNCPSYCFAVPDSNGKLIKKCD